LRSGALAISQGDLTTFFTQPFSAGVLAITALVLVGPSLWERLARRESVVA
jgi:putative tricarboxylic transport membrane protein